MLISFSLSAISSRIHRRGSDCRLQTTGNINGLTVVIVVDEQS